jgi:hypothetical protein
MQRTPAGRGTSTEGMVRLRPTQPWIQALIEASRRHVVSTANLTLV